MVGDRFGRRRLLGFAAFALLLGGGTTIGIVSGDHAIGPTHTRVVASAPARVPTRISRTPLRVVRVLPSPKAIGVPGTAPITLGFSAPLRRNTALPTIRPAIAGSWSRPNSHELRFTPASPILPLTRVVISLPSGLAGLESTSGEVLPATVASAYTVAPGSVERLQQLLAELDYLPVTFEPSPNATLQFSEHTDAPVTTTPSAPSDALDSEPTVAGAIPLTPRSGTFHWRFPAIPPDLGASFVPGVFGAATLGAIIAFESEHNLTIDGSPGPEFWSALLTAVADRDPTTRPYDYVVVTETEPETLDVWQEGKVILSTPVNTGVAGAATALGTWPVYLRYTSATMTGTNPDGTHYSDPGVPWISYFNGSEAVHGFPRAAYGFPQSDGCVEVPIATAAQVYPLDPYGTLVTITTGDLATKLGVASAPSSSPSATTVPSTTVPSTTVPSSTVPPTTAPSTTTPTG